MGTRMFLEVDGDQVTAVELSGDLAVSSVTFDAGTVRDSLAAALSGFRQRRSDPPVEVSLVPPGFRFVRLDLTADDFAAADRVVSKVTDGGDFLPAVWMPAHPPEDGYTAPGYALAAAPELVAEVRDSLSQVRHRLMLSPSVVPGDGVWVGVHASCSILSVVRGGLLLDAVQLPCGGLGTVAALVDPEDARRGMASVVASLAGSSDASMLVEAELGRFYRALTRSVAVALEEVAGSVSDLKVAFMGLGASQKHLDEAVRSRSFPVGLPDEVLLALNYLPVRRRLPSLAALSSAVSSPPLVGGSAPAVAAPDLPQLWGPLLAGTAATAVAVAAVLALGSQALTAHRLDASLAALPPHVAAADDLQRFLAEGTDHPQAQLLAALPALEPAGMRVSGMVWDEGGLMVRLSGRQEDVRDLPRVLEGFRSLTGLDQVETVGLVSDGMTSTVTLRVGDFDDE